MPELPEVETIARRLREVIVGKRIVEIQLSGLPLRKPVDEGFPRFLRGRSISRILRRGKYLIAELDPQGYWLIHLGMSGRILYHQDPMPVEKHTQAVIRFADGSELHYKDHRRFGLLAGYPVERLSLVPELKAVGKDPMGGGLREDWLFSEICRSRREVKAFLLDQRKIAGLGNIYVCEVLHRAKIHPSRRCFTVTREETHRLRLAIRRVLSGAIRNRGTSFSDFRGAFGELGSNQNFLRVFQREGEKCRQCHARIQRLRQGNRSSFFCPCCQADKKKKTEYRIQKTEGRS